jgi:hypothetical protein
MPRIRSVKPEIHQDEAVGELTDSAFRLFIGLITLADDYGRLKGGRGLLNSQIWPYAPKPLDEVDALLDELASAGLIQRYEVDGKPFVCLPSWSEHQRISNAGKSRIPEPEKDTRGNSPRDSASLGDSRLDQGEERRGSRRGVGGESAASAASPTTTIQQVIASLEQVTFTHSLPSPSVDATEKFCEEFADRFDLAAQVSKFAHYWTGPAAKRDLPGRDALWSFRTWLERDRGDSPKLTKTPAGRRDPSRYDAVVEPAR